MNISRLLTATALASATLAFPQVAFAQDTAPVDEASDDATPSETIIVTGSRITRPTLDSPVPITSIAPGELTSQGNVVLGDTLNELPSLRNTYNSGNSTRFIGTAGLNLLDLRGLGISRTLVLVNGRRHVTASPGDFLVDTNTIPVDLLERTDIVTGGNSAIYGSDAVAGVVNFVLKRDFEGVLVKGQGGISSRGDRGSYFTSVTAGKNFADGRGNIAFSGEYAKTNPLYFTDRDGLTGAYSGRCQFQTVDADPITDPNVVNGSDGIADTAFLCGVRNGSISDGGTIGGLGNGSYLRFAPNGNLVVDNSDRNFTGAGSGNVIGGMGSTLRNTGQLAAGLERYAMNILAHYDVSDAFRPFIEAKYVRVNAVQEGQPSFFQGSIPANFGGGSNIRCNNPFLNSQALTTLQGYGICRNAATGTFNMSRFNIDFGGRGELHKRDTYRIVGGVEGTFNDDWRYEVAFNYGRFESRQRSLNNLQLFDIDGNEDGFLLALNAVNAPAGFTGSNFALGANGQRAICAVNAVSNVRPDCVPINVFGFGAPSAAALNFVNTEAIRTERAEQFVASAFINGDLSQLFELPGGPVAFAIGAEYRRETAYSAFDPLTQSGATFLNAIQPFTPPAFDVKEAFAEISIPLLKNLPGADLLEISGAGRVSDYNSAVGTVWAYNLSGIYRPIPDLSFRAGYSTSVRAPTLSDLYSPQSENFAQLTDPCDVNSIGNEPDRVANCAAAGVPRTMSAAAVAACADTAFNATNGFGVGTPFVNCLARTASTAYTSGGNPSLVQEKGKSLTLGAVFTPRFLPGFSFTVDYFDIEVENLIASLGAQQLLNLCYDNNGGLNSTYCASIQRDAATGLFVEPAVLSSGVNYARQKLRGVDLDLSYRHTFGDGSRLNLRAIASHLLTLNNFTDPTNPNLPNRQKSELGSPVWSFNMTAAYDTKDFDLQYTMRYTGKQTIGTYETQNSWNGLPPTNADAYPFIYYPEAFIHNVRVGFNITRDRTFFLGVDNVLDTAPKFGLLGTESGSPVNSIGRFIYAGINFRLK